jgi:hypothetical protein
MDEADIANEAAERNLEAARSRAIRNRPVRDPSFCECDCWREKRQFCGDKICADLYQVQERQFEIRGESAA